MPTKTIEKMSRTELIYAIAAKANPAHFHQIAVWPTEAIRRLLAYYQRPEEKEKYIRLKFESPALHRLEVQIEKELNSDIAEKVKVELFLIK